MADECTETLNKEQFTIVIRWLSEDLQDHEDFIGLYEVGNITADCLVQQSEICCDALETAFEISKLIKFSPKRNATFGRIKADIPEEKAHTGVGVRSFCPIR